MTMYTDSTLKPVYTGQAYTSPRGTQYPSNFPKDKIPGLHAVKETERPTEENLTVTGFTINDKYEQVWLTEEKETATFKTEMKNILAAYRYNKEVGGLTLNGQLIVQTDRESRPNLIAARMMATENPAYTVTWKAVNNAFVTLNAQQVIEIADAVAIHVQKCFSVEADISAQIEAGTIQLTTAAIQAAFDEAYAA